MSPPYLITLSVSVSPIPSFYVDQPTQHQLGTITAQLLCVVAGIRGLCLCKVHILYNSIISFRDSCDMQLNTRSQTDSIPASAMSSRVVVGLGLGH